MAWDEHPGMLKTLQDRNYAMGVNRIVYHVFTHNPWIDRKPGMTLDGVGLLFQRDQTWWKPGKAWVEYAERAQKQLQKGTFVADVAVFTGEEIPRRAILPDRLINTLPGIFGKERVANEKARLENKGLPMKQMPEGVNVSANLYEPENWNDPLRGYAYDSFNPDALLRLARVENGRVVFPGGASYGILVFPGKHHMQPNNRIMSVEAAEKILQLTKAGATILLAEQPVSNPGLAQAKEKDQRLMDIAEELWGGTFNTIHDGEESFQMKRLGQGRVVMGPYYASSFAKLGIGRDVEISDSFAKAASGFVWTHRKDKETDIYFVANQDSVQKEVTISLRATGRVPELYDAVSGESFTARSYTLENGKTQLTYMFEPNASVFITLTKPIAESSRSQGKNWIETEVMQTLAEPWAVSFDSSLGGPIGAVPFKKLVSWSAHPDSLIRNYSGTASYTNALQLKTLPKGKKVYLELGEIANIAEVIVNGKNCGVVWTAPYRADVTSAIRKGANTIEILVTNTWANRLMADQRVPQEKRITHTTAPFRLKGKQPLKGGLLGPVKLIKSK